jgi:hypothetical protein
MNSGQSPHQRPLVNRVSFLVLLVALSIGPISCTSIYHRARTELPPEPAAELSRRVAEAGQAESLARQAGARLLDSLQQGKLPAVTETDFDRLEAAAFELERRVWAARDVAQRCDKPVDGDGEIKRLSGQAHSWLEYVHANRTADPVTQLRQLHAVLP